MLTRIYRPAMGRLFTMAWLATLLVVLTGRICLAEDKDAHQVLTNAVRQFETVQSYTCRLEKRVAKSGRLHEDPDIFVKYMKPAHYYFRWDSGTRQGREAIFAAGKHDGKIVAHSGGLFRFVTLRLDPEGRLAMREHRHSLMHSGLEKIIHLVETDYQRARENGWDAIRRIDRDKVEGRRVWKIESRFPEHQGYYAQKVVLYIDEILRLPIKVSIYDGSQALVEEYIFRDLKINVGLTGRDFEMDHPDYHFHRRRNR